MSEWKSVDEHPKTDRFVILAGELAGEPIRCIGWWAVPSVAAPRWMIFGGKDWDDHEEFSEWQPTRWTELPE